MRVFGLGEWHFEIGVKTERISAIVVRQDFKEARFQIYGEGVCLLYIKCISIYPYPQSGHGVTSKQPTGALNPDMDLNAHVLPWATVTLRGATNPGSFGNSRYAQFSSCNIDSEELRCITSFRAFLIGSRKLCGSILQR